MSTTVSTVGSMFASLGADGVSSPSRDDLGFMYSFNQRVEAVINLDAPTTDLIVGLNRLATDGGRVVFVRVDVGQCTVKLNNGAPSPLAAGAGFLLQANLIIGWLFDVKISTPGPAKIVVRVYG